MLVVTFTSWSKRIQNCEKTIQQLLDQTILPDKIYLNLSIEEFPSMGKMLPKNLVDIATNSNGRVVINWVEGENTKTMKKIFPILKYLENDDIIINVDDDMCIPKKFIETYLNEYNTYKQPISGGNRKCHKICANLGLDQWNACTPNIFPKKMLDGWEKLTNIDIIHTYNDDTLYGLIALYNGYLFKPTSVMGRHTSSTKEKIRPQNDNNALGKNKGYSPNNVVVKLFDENLFKVTGVHIQDYAKKCHIDNSFSNNYKNGQLKDNICSNSQTNKMTATQQEYKLIPFAGGFIKKKI